MGARDPSPPVRTEGSQGRVATGWDLPPGSGSAQLRGLSTLTALSTSAFRDTLAVSLHGSSPARPWTPRRDVSEPGESDSPSRLPNAKLTSPRPYPLLGTGPVGRVLPGCVQENRCVSGRQGAPTSLSARVLPEAPRIEAFLPPAGPGGRLGDPRGAGRPAKQAPGGRLPAAQLRAAALRRALSRALS